MGGGDDFHPVAPGDGCGGGHALPGLRSSIYLLENKQNATFSSFVWEETKTFLLELK